MQPLPNLQQFFRRFPTLDLGDYVLRDMMLADKYDYYELMADPKVNEYLSDEDVPKNADDAEQEIKFWSGLFYRKICPFWGIAEKKTNRMIGTIGFNYWVASNRRTEVTYDLKSAYWRKGIMSQALAAVLNFAFDKMAVQRIEARTMQGNEPSQKILEKFGFQHEGLIRNYRIIHGAPTDIVQLSLIPSDVEGASWRDG